MADASCPECGSRIHRSHTRGISEKLVKVFTQSRAYRCHECGWRGWIAKRQHSVQGLARRNIIQIVLSLLAIVVITAIVLYITKS